MKVEVINRSTKTTIETYSVTDFSMFDFQEWKNLREVVIHLNRLSDAVTKLDSKDPETQEPVSYPKEVDVYLPDPLRNRVFSRLARSQVNMDELSNQFSDTLEKVTESVSTPELKSSTVFSAVVTEILQNHEPHTDYEVRISE